MRTFNCPVAGCTEKVEYVRSDGEEVLVRPGQDINKIRKAPVQRLILVRCPVHGEKYHLEIGHHISVRR